MISNKEIHDICKRYLISNYTINPDGSIDVDGDVSIANGRLTKLPLKFNKVSGDFYCSYNELTSLEGCPKYVGGSFFCSGNRITTLEGGPDIVNSNYFSNFNDLLISTKGFPSIVSNDVSIRFCHKLTSLEDYNLSYEKLDIDNKVKIIRKHKISKLYEKISTY
jgi:hypothetical protein